MALLGGGGPVLMDGRSGPPTPPFPLGLCRSCLGWRPIDSKGKAGDYKWLTYKEAKGGKG